ncbi:hypothetical protein V2J09_000905 [Rumex salicifolius]
MAAFLIFGCLCNDMLSSNGKYHGQCQEMKMESMDLVTKIDEEKGEMNEEIPDFHLQGFTDRLKQACFKAN